MRSEDISLHICTPTVRCDKDSEGGEEGSNRMQFFTVHSLVGPFNRIGCRNADAAAHDEVGGRPFGTLSSYRSANEPCNR